MPGFIAVREALPLARLVTQAEIIPDTDRAIDRVHEPDFDAATTAILPEEPGCELSETETAGSAARRNDAGWLLAHSNYVVTYPRCSSSAKRIILAGR